jgi:hypothetical protein
MKISNKSSFVFCIIYTYFRRMNIIDDIHGKIEARKS